MKRASAYWATAWSLGTLLAAGSAGADEATVAAERGRPVYERHCAPCHGRGGDGRGPAARFLADEPRDFTLGAFKWRSTPSGALPTDDDLARTVRRGAPGTSMPSWGRILGEPAIRDVVAYVKTFSPRFRSARPAPLALPDAVPVLDEAASRRGRNVYVLMRCFTCHGLAGEGDGPAAATLRDDRGRPILPYNFTDGRFHSGGRPIDIYRTFSTGVNGTPMPSFDEALLIGREAFGDLSELTTVVEGRRVEDLRRFVATMPTSDELDSMPEQARVERSARLRWDLVAYVRSLASGGTFRAFTGDPHVTE